MMIAASDSQSIRALRYAGGDSVNCIRFAVYTSATLTWDSQDVEIDLVLVITARTILASTRAKYNRYLKSQVLLTRRRFLPNAIAASESRLV